MLTRSYRSNFPKILNDEIQFGCYIDENGKQYFGDTHFYGDLCEYSKKRLVEQSIQQVEMRFNTAQREVCSLDKSYKYFKTLYYDEIISDDFDENLFESKEYEINNANQKKEGFCYYPHYEIPLKTFSKNITSQPSIVMTLVKIEVAWTNEDDENDIRFKLKTMNNHNLQINDTIYIKYNEYYIDSNIVEKTIYYICYVTDIIDNKWFECIIETESHERVKTLNVIDVSNYRLFKKDNLIPDYATFSKDGSCRFVWRDILYNGFDSTSDIEIYPFMNGALYVNKQIDLFVKRQDPNEYTKILSDDIPSQIMKIEEQDNYYTETEMLC